MTKGKKMGWSRNSVAAIVILVAGSGGLTACVQIATPDKPIEINLNINIKQEVVYRLDGDAKKLIDQNADIF